MSFALLPQELVNAVCDHVPPTDLAALARASSAVSDAAIRSLYRNPGPLFLSQSYTPAEDMARKMRLLRTLADRPDIARLVRSFFISLDLPNESSQHLFLLLARALAHMSQLASLTLRLDPGASWILNYSPDASSIGVTPDGGGGRDPTLYDGLLYFSCPFLLDVHVTAFLARTSSLRELELDSTPSTADIARLCDTAIPQLTSLISSARVAEMIAPGRPLHTVCIHAGDVDEDILRKLSHSSAPQGVRVLAATTSMSTIPFLEAMSRYLAPEHVNVTTTSSEFATPPGQVRVRHSSEVLAVNRSQLQIFYDQVAAVLDSMPHLVALQLSGLHWSAQTTGSLEKRTWSSTPFVGHWPGAMRPPPHHGGTYNGANRPLSVESDSEYDFFDYLS